MGLMDQQEKRIHNRAIHTEGALLFLAWEYGLAAAYRGILITSFRQIYRRHGTQPLLVGKVHSTWLDPMKPSGALGIRSNLEFSSRTIIASGLTILRNLLDL